MVFLEHRPPVALTTLLVEATALLFVQQHVKGAIIVDHVTPPHGKNDRSMPDDILASHTLPQRGKNRPTSACFCGIHYN